MQLSLLLSEAQFHSHHLCKNVKIMTGDHRRSRSHGNSKSMSARNATCHLNLNEDCRRIFNRCTKNTRTGFRGSRGICVAFCKPRGFLQISAFPRWNIHIFLLKMPSAASRSGSWVSETLLSEKPTREEICVFIWEVTLSSTLQRCKRKLDFGCAISSEACNSFKNPCP